MSLCCFLANSQATNLGHTGAAGRSFSYAGEMAAGPIFLPPRAEPRPL